MRHLNAPFACQVRVEEELFLQLKCLVAAVGLATSSASGSYWENKVKLVRYISDYLVKLVVFNTMEYGIKRMN